MNKVLLAGLSAVLLAVVCEGNPQPYDEYGYYTTENYRYRDPYYNDYNDRYYNRYRDEYISYNYGYRRSFLEEIVESIAKGIGDVFDWAEMNILRPLGRRMSRKFSGRADELTSFLDETFRSYEKIIREVEDIFTGRDQPKIDVQKEKTEVTELRSKFKTMADEIRTSEAKNSGEAEMMVQNLLKEARYQLAGDLGNMEESLWTKIKKLEFTSVKVRDLALNQLDQLSTITSNFFETVEEFNSELFGKGTKSGSNNNGTRSG